MIYVHENERSRHYYHKHETLIFLIQHTHCHHVLTLFQNTGSKVCCSFTSDYELTNQLISTSTMLLAELKQKPVVTSIITKIFTTYVRQNYSFGLNCNIKEGFLALNPPKPISTIPPCQVTGVDNVFYL